VCGRVLPKLGAYIIRVLLNVWPAESIFNYCFSTECKRVNSDICSAPKYDLAPCKTLRLLTSFHCCYQIFCPNSILVIEIIRTEVGILVLILQVTFSRSQLASNFLNWGLLCFHFNHDCVSVYYFISSFFPSHLSFITALRKSRSHTKTLILKGGQAPWSFAIDHVTARWYHFPNKITAI
jgi:hypothetical protein